MFLKAGWALRTMFGFLRIISACCLSCAGEGVGIAFVAAFGVAVFFLLIELLLEALSTDGAVDVNKDSISFADTNSSTNLTKSPFSEILSSFVSTLSFFFLSNEAAFAFNIFFNCLIDRASNDFKNAADSGLTALLQANLCEGQCSF